MHVFYLHGFASSAKSSKAAFFAGRLARHGVPLLTPDFNQPDFEHLTVTRMIAQVKEAVSRVDSDGAAGLSGRPPVALIGSSLGAFVAAHATAQQDAWNLPARIDRLVLLAPALDFGGNRMRDLGDAGLARWKETDRLDVFHHAYEKTMCVRYALYEDAARYDSFALDLRLPVLIFQGTRDEAVDPAVPARFARGRANVILRRLDDDHQLLASLETMWPEIERFLGLG